MKDIATVMSVAGENAYFEFAEYSIPSFLRNNVTADLFVFTDNIEKIKNISVCDESRLFVIDLKEEFKKHPAIVEKFRAKGAQPEQLVEHTKTYGYYHDNVLVTALNPIADSFLRGNRKYSHILKVDSDSYFCGGDMMALVKEEIARSPSIELFLVERKHPLMEIYGGGKPGSGFTLWRKSDCCMDGGGFIPEYVKRFDKSAQITILKMRKRKVVSVKMLIHPGFHFVRPFWQAEKTRGVFTKEMAEEFLPAYFHLYGAKALENLKVLDSWFGDNK